MDEGNSGFIELTCILKTSDQKTGNAAWSEFNKKRGKDERESRVCMRGREYYSKVLVLHVDAHPTLSFPFQLSFTWATSKVILKTK